MMESDQNPAGYVETTTSDVAEQNVEVVEEVSALTKMPSSDQSIDQLRQVKEKISDFLATFQELFGEFFEEYRQILILVLLIVTGTISLKLLLAVLGAVNEVPLLNPFFEIVGISYTAWFVYRYLWRASSRQELSQEISTLKNQVLGNKSSDS